jgi:hypothetical protein
MPYVQEHYEREEAARQGRPYKPSHRLYIPKRRRELERLEEELEAAREGGAKEDFRTQVGGGVGGGSCE